MALSIRNYLPFQQAPVKTSKALAIPDDSIVQKIFKVASLAVGFNRFSSISVQSRNNFEASPYDFDRIIQAINTDSYAKQSFNKYKELMWKEGWDIVGENPKAIDYLQNRLKLMEVAMNRPFEHFLIDIGDHVVKFANCFVVKSRADIRPYFKGGRINGGPEGKDPILGYYILPTQMVEIERNRWNKPLKYRQRLDDTFDSAKSTPTWKADEVLHFYVDKDPSTAFGTPFMSAVMDDIVALRQVEEDIQNLVHRELFPLYKYKVGTELVPAEPEEIAAAARELENLRTEGGLVLPERHDVEVVGAEAKALDATDYLQHFKERVAVGLGLTPHHLGMTMNGGNRSVSERLDAALYDKIKLYQKCLANMIELYIFNEILAEGGFDPYTNPMTGESDRCEFRFHEIDKDSQIKTETHEIQKFTNNIATKEETRLALRLDPQLDESETLAAMQARMQVAVAALQPQQQTETKQAGGTTSTGAKTPAKTTKTVPAANPQADKLAKNIDNKIRPANQFTKKSSPNIRRDDKDELDWLNDIVELFEEES